MKIPSRALRLVPAILVSAGLSVVLAQQQDPQQPPGTAQPAAPAGQQQPERTQQPPIRSGINFVRVDVIVTDKQGEPVMDLKEGDFSVLEDGKPQKIDSFSVVRIDPHAAIDEPTPKAIRNDFDEEREAARPDVRLFVILLDDYHVQRGADLSVKKPLIDFIQNQLAPADMVALMYPLTPVADLHFTRDRDSLISAINKFEGRKFNYEPRNQFEDQYAYYPAQVVENVRNQVTMGALKGAAVRLGGLREGRKSIIFVSEGFTGLLPAQMQDPIAAMPGVGNPYRGSSTDSINERAEFLTNTDMLSDMRDVYDIANRQNTSIYAVDPRGLAAFEYDISKGDGLQTDKRSLDTTMDTLRVLAANTDGRAIVNRNDLATGMKQIIRDSSGYYLLGYNSAAAPTDGRFHEIKVRVTRKGVDVRARKGYWAYTAADAARASAPPKPEAPSAVTDALNAIAEPPRGRPARFWIGTSRGDNGRTKVTFVWDPIPPPPGDRRDESAVPARVSLTATTPDGRPVFRGRVPDAASGGAGSSSSTDNATPAQAPNMASPQSTAAGGRGAGVSFEVPPGQVQLRVVVEGNRGQVLDSAVRELTAPDYTTVQVSLGTPRVYRARTPRDVQAIRSDPNATPTTDREFSRAERMIVLVDAYAPGGATPTVTAKLLNRTGKPMADVPLQMAGSTAQFELPLSALAAGDYLIEVNAKTPEGTAQNTFAFKVGR
jgi:VWFA-related protein